MRSPSRRHARRSAKAIIAALSLVGGIGLVSAAAPASVAAASSYKPGAYGEIDCNGQSPVQKPIKPNMICTDIRGFSHVDNANNWGSRFYDNNQYIGHDEPDMTFLSGKAGSGDNVTWSETLGTDPSAAPTDTSPGSDISHWFELSIAPWYSMAMCDSNSYPLNPCKAESDSNAPTSSYTGGGSAFMEMQFYPPGFAPFDDAISCDNTHWCAALTIDSLECTYGFASCNDNCIEPVNFAFISTNGVPAGPPSPQLADLQTFTPNSNTLLMNPGDKVTVHMSDAAVPGHRGQHAFEVVIHDATTGQTGYMQASAANGFANTSIADCSGTPYNFQPEYSTAGAGDIVPWAALQTDVSTEYEIGHWTSCSSLGRPAQISLGPSVKDKYYNTCSGPYESAAPGGDGGSAPETSDALCYPAGDTHGKLHSSPDLTTGCLDDYYQNGDLDFDGSPYWKEWPTSTTAGTYPGSFVERQPLSGGSGYSKFFMQTDTALSESTCSNGDSGCAIPPPNAPGGFYPYWSRVPSGTACTLEFGNVAKGNTYGADAQYGIDRFSTLGYDEFESPRYPTSSC